MAPILNVPELLPVMECFYSIQGEGYHQGKAAYFIRLAGCDVGCTWCDVKESWNAEAHPRIDVHEMTREAGKFPSGIVVITGGEPLMHSLDGLTASLRKSGSRTHLETSGSWPMSGTWDWICLSPKKFRPPLPGIFNLAHELKIIIYNTSDFAWAEKHASLVGPACRLYLQPEWSRAAKVTPMLVDYIRDHPRWELSLQIHKYIQVP
ncbi:MAG TPA: 7-carboxy-7-deazaguanine synthase QueE [Chitinophagaceae bacterium]|nr:7-carboxy-7-deazaguanine synthase QueE [Chitinophagaceae bacterium]